MTVVSFSDFRPVPRYDGIPWTHAIIAESATKNGPWTQIDNIVLVPDADPAHPSIRNFTTSLATLVSGWYRVTFTDNAGAAEQPVAPIQNNPASQQEYLPSLTDVALKIISRTRDKYGNTLGTFTGITTPTDTQVSQIITKVAPQIADVVGDDVPDALIDDVAQVVALKAAMQIELDFYPDQINTNRSPYPQLKEEYESELTRISRAVVVATEGGVVGPTGSSGMTSYSFPEATKWLSRPM